MCDLKRMIIIHTMETQQLIEKARWMLAVTVSSRCLRGQARLFLSCLSS